MTSQLQTTESLDTTSPELDPATSSDLPMLPPAKQSDEKWQEIMTKISSFLGQLPDYTGRFFQDYQQPITNVALILATLIALRVLLAVLDALKVFPLLLPTFELIGIAYSIWFVQRYLLKASDRQELWDRVQDLKQQFFSSEQLSEEA